jgi:putative Mg2+ transporter-C (MgtC) family protein
MLPWWESFLRLLTAVVLSVAIGWERERAHKPAGVRTHLLVGLGSALFMIVSLEVFSLFHGRGDPGRIAAQVVSGIGFIGAGTIIHGEEGLVRGLTTAASVWAVAGVGLACGAGFYVLAAMTTGLLLGSVYMINRYLSTEPGNGNGTPRGKPRGL